MSEDGSSEPGRPPAGARSRRSRRPGSLEISPLPREEYVEQMHLFQVLGERLRENMPAQEILDSVREEILATTKLPMAVDFMLSELRHLGGFSTAMERLTHYFTPFQSFVMAEAENDRQRFDLRIGLEVLRREAKYRAEGATRQGLFLFQLEVLSRNRMGYDAGLEAIAQDPAYDEAWRNWILTVRRQIGIIDLADLMFVRSEFYHERKAAEQGDASQVDALDRRGDGAGISAAVRPAGGPHRVGQPQEGPAAAVRRPAPATGLSRGPAAGAGEPRGAAAAGAGSPGRAT